MAFDAHKNFAISTVAVAPIPASSGTALTVATGDGTKFPAASFNAVVWPTATNPTTANAEIVRVTVIATDVFTITRTRESTSARTIVVGDQIAACLTAQSLTDIEGLFPVSVANGGTGDTTLTAHGVLMGNGTSAVAISAAGTAGQPFRSGGSGADGSYVAITTGLISNASPASSNSTSTLMVGLAGAITPVGSGAIHVTICGDVKTSSTSGTPQWQIAYGTGTAPANGDAATGTVVGSLQSMTTGSSSKSFPFSLSYIISGLTPNTAYWLDLQRRDGTTSTTTFQHVSVIAFEL